MNLALAPWFQRAWTPAARRPATAAAQPSQALHKNATLVMRHPMSVTVQCVQGSLWLTHDGDCKDIILAPGEWYCSAKPQRLLVHALQPSQVRLAG